MPQINLDGTGSASIQMHNAEEVLTAAKLVMERRRKSRIIPPAKPIPEAIKAPVVSFKDMRSPEARAAEILGISEALLREALKSTQGMAPLSMHSIKKAVCAVWGISEIELISTRKSYDVAQPRFVVMTLCRTLTIKSTTEIGLALGGRDHTTIIHGCRKMMTSLDNIKSWIAPNATLMEWVLAFRKELPLTHAPQKPKKRKFQAFAESPILPRQPDPHHAEHPADVELSY